MRTWSTSEARSRLREVLDAAGTEPQRISRGSNGDTVIVLSEAQFESLSRKDRRTGRDLIDAIRSGPLMDPAFDEIFEEIQADRARGVAREIEF